MRRSTTLWAACVLAGLLSLMIQPAIAQAPSDSLPPITGDRFVAPDGRPGFINCFMNSSGEVILPDGMRSPLSGQSFNGYAFTPKGDTRFLVVYAGFIADNDPLNPNIPQNSGFAVSTNDWPQDDPVHGHGWGESFPRTAYGNALFY